MRILLPLVLAAALMLSVSGCGAANGEGLKGSSEPYAEVSPSPVASEAVGDVKHEAAAGEPAVSPPYIAAKVKLSSGEAFPRGGYTLSAPETLSITFPGDGTPVNFIELSSSGGAFSVSVSADGREVYLLEGAEGPVRTIRFDETLPKELLVKITPEGGETELSGVRAGRALSETLLHAYIPVAMPVSSLSAYLPTLKSLESVTVISGLSWNGDGSVDVISDNYEGLVSELTGLGTEHGFLVLATVYPASKLVKAGEAGLSVGTPEKRQKLIGSLAEHAKARGLGGVDYDWESQRDSGEWQSFGELLIESRAAFSAEGLRLTAAFYPESLKNLSEAALLAPDLINLMLYDTFDDLGRHAAFPTFTGDVSAALDLGIKPQQLSAGIPAYGRPLDKSLKWPLYNEQGDIGGDEIKGGSYFNNRITVRDKAAFLETLGVNNLFLYHLLGDYPVGDPLSLLGAL